jgi:hypothetical protein
LEIPVRKLASEIRVGLRVRNPGLEIRVGNPENPEIRIRGLEIRVRNPGFEIRKIRKSGWLGNPGRKSGSEIRVRKIRVGNPGSENWIGNPGRNTGQKSGFGNLGWKSGKSGYPDIRKIRKIRENWLGNPGGVIMWS